MFNEFQFDAGERLRTSQLTTLADLKCLNVDDALLWENVGTGTGTFANNKYDMSVTAGQYRIRKSRRYYPYFSGKSQQVEFTMDTFAPQDGIVKRYGYFSSNAVAPYDQQFDGFFLQSDSDGVTFNVYKMGIEIYKINLNKSHADVPLDGYDWNNFTVIEMSYLWLGGAAARMFARVGTGFAVGDIFNYAGTTPGLIVRSPNHCVRAEIRSTTGTGSMRQICAQVSTEGSINESGKSFSVDTGNAANALPTIGTTYPLIAIRKKAGFRDVPIRVSDYVGLITSASDVLRLAVQVNPTLAGTALVWADVPNSAFQMAVGSSARTVSAAGHILSQAFVRDNSVMPYGAMDNEYLSWLGVNIADTSDVIALCGTPLTASCNTYAELDVLQY